MLSEADRLAFRKQKQSYLREMQSAFDDRGKLKDQPERKLTAALQEYIAAPFTALCSSWPRALRILLKVFAIGEGDAVFMPVRAPLPLLREVLQAGAKPIFVALHPRTFTIDVRALQEAIKEVMSEAIFRARLILAIDSFGLPCDYPALQKIAERYGMFLFDLSLGGPGGTWHKQPCPSFGDAGILSFYKHSQVPALSDGAALFAADAEICRKLSAELSEDLYELNDRHTIGSGAKLHPLECAYLSVRLAQYRSSELSRLNELASFYSAQLQDIIDPPFVPAGFESGWQAYALKLPDKLSAERFRSVLARRGIESFLPEWYDLASAYRKISDEHEHDSLARKAEAASAFAEQLLILPLHPYLTLNDAREVVAVMRELLTKPPEETYKAFQESGGNDEESMA